MERGTFRTAFGAGDYRAGWFLLDDDTVELRLSVVPDFQSVPRRWPIGWHLTE